MPGLSVLHGPDRRSIDIDDLFESIEFFDGYRSEREITTPETVISQTGYDEYPVERFETDDAVLLREGHLYDGQIDPDRLSSLVSNRRYDDLEEWLLEQDGDFLIAIYFKDTDEIVLLNDALGRLPTYYATIGETAVVSRELKFVREFARRIGVPLAVDQLAIAQQLVFEHQLGTRTVFDDVRSIPPGSLLRITDGDVHVTRLNQFDFSEKRHADKSVTENAEALASKFRTACENRHLDGTTSIISLSGGLDSRVVAGGYHDAGIPFSTVTFDNANGLYESELGIAESIADTLGAEWTPYRAKSTPTHRSDLLDTKQGMNNVGMTFILDFFEQLRSDHDAITYVTGDGGDKLLVDHTPPRQPKSVSDLVDLLLETNGRIPVPEAAAVADIAPDRLRESIHDRLRSYPESEPSEKYTHFLYRERGFNLLHHGEDRNRYYFWSVSPFYSLPVFQYAINCPEEQKSQRALYKAHLGELAPELLEFEYADFGTPLTSIEYRIKQRLMGFLSRHRELRDFVARILKDETGVTEDIAERIESTLTESSDLEPLSEREIRAIVRDHDSYRPYGLNTLYTAVLLVQGLSRTPEQRPSERAIQ